MSLLPQWSLVCCMVCTILSFTTNTADSCFITNCPRGGKRNLVVGKRSSNYNECPRCGPQGLGRCFGPNLCCGPLMGCNQKFSSVCSVENESTVPCWNVDVPTCKAVQGGQCVMRDYCCNSLGECATDLKCPAMPRRPLEEEATRKSADMEKTNEDHRSNMDNSELLLQTLAMNRDAEEEVKQLEMDDYSLRDLLYSRLQEKMGEEQQEDKAMVYGSRKEGGARAH